MNLEQLEQALRKQKTKRVQLNEKLEAKKNESLAIIDEIEANIANLTMTEDVLEEKESRNSEILAEYGGFKTELETLNTEIENLEQQIKGKKQKTQANIKTQEGSDTKMKDINAKVHQFYSKTLHTNTLPENIRAEYTNGVTTDGNELIIKDATYYEFLPKEKIDLSKLFRTKKVSAPTGRFFINPEQNITLSPVNEFQATPVLEIDKFKEITYSTQDYAGVVAVSDTFKETYDPASNALNEFYEALAIAAVNTKNVEIVDMMKTFPKRTINNFDELKSLTNTGVKASYSTVLLMTQSAFDEIDRAKLVDGSYILNPDVANATKGRFNGQNLLVVDDEYLGNKGDKVAFYGADSSILLIDRKQSSTRWVDNRYRGELVDQVVSFDTQKLLTDQGYFLTFDLQAPAEVPAG